MKRLLLAVIATAFLWAMPVHAANSPQLTISSSYELLATGRTVRATYTLSPAASGDFTIKLPVSGLQSLKLTYFRSDNPLDVKTKDTELERAGQTIKATEFSFNLSQKKTATLSFETDSLARQYAKSTVFALPSIPVSEALVKDTELTVPASRGLGIAYASEPVDTSIGGDQQSYRFVADDKGSPQVLLLFGSAVTSQVQWQTRLVNGGWWWRTVQLVLPPDTNQQTVYLKSIDPKPSHLRVDQDGNVIAEYRIWPKKSITVTAEALINLRGATYNTTNTRTLADMPQQLSGYTTGRSESADTAVLSIIKKAFDQATSRLASTDADAVVTGLRDDLQSAGVPTRELHGLRFIQGGQLVEPSATGRWLESFVPGIGWMTLDPVAGLYGRNDFQRLGLAITSPLSQPSLPTNYKDVTTNFVDQTLPSADFSQTSVKVTKYILLPGLSLTRTRLQMPSGGVLDNATVAGAAADSYLGSLAPLQRVSRWSLSLAGAAWQTGEVQFGPGGSNGIGEVLAHGSASLNYVGVAAEVLVLAVIIALMIKWRKSRGRNQPVLDQRSDEADIAAEDLLNDRPMDDMSA